VLAVCQYNSIGRICHVTLYSDRAAQVQKVQ
jgi:hypothetical protein